MTRTDKKGDRKMMPLSLTVSAELHAELQRRARAEDRSVAYIVRRAVERDLAASNQERKS
jgi:predicted transcriptional regulator